MECRRLRIRLLLREQGEHWEQVVLGTRGTLGTSGTDRHKKRIP